MSDASKPADDLVARRAYGREQATHHAKAAFLEQRARSLGAARLGVAAAIVALLGGVLWGGLGAVGWLGMALLAIGFAGLVVVHARIDGGKQRALAAERFYARGLARLDHAWDSLPLTSTRFETPGHPFASDLDLFGRASLMQLVDATETRAGEERLASWLSAETRDSWPDKAMAHQAAVRDLVPRLHFREKLATSAAVLGAESTGPAALLAWAEGGGVASLGVFSWLRWISPGAALAAGALASVAIVPAPIASAVEVLAIALGFAAGARLGSILDTVSARESSVTRWREMLAAVEAESFDAPLLRALRDRLIGSGKRASEEMTALERAVGFVDARRNEVFRFLIGPMLMWDAHCARALLVWRARAGVRVRGWLDALADMEALASLAAFADEHPEFAFPELEAKAIFDARALGHPLLSGDRRVENDVCLRSAGVAMVVTGSNMSGKSTLLRAVGINAVLAFAGAPVCARSLRLGPVRVATSMRIEDSLAQGVSHFYAELERLKQVIDLARDPAAKSAVLFLLDEILHGTNSRERILGACSVVRHLLAAGALGAVSTHDIGITALERELGGVVQNVHLEEQVSGSTMTFDYVLRPGIVQSSNALRLMRAVGIDVDAEL